MAVRTKSTRPTVASLATDVAALTADMKIVKEGFHQQGVLLEAIRSDQKAFMEGMFGMFEQLSREFREEFARVHARIDVLEEVVRENSRDIKKNSEDIKKNSEDIKKNSEDIRELRAEVAGLRADLNKLRADFDKREEVARIDALEARVSALEQKVGTG